MKIIIIYHSGFGHTKAVAECIARGASSVVSKVLLVPVDQAEHYLNELNEADTIVFGSPTYFGNVSAEFKKFMELTGSIWYKQLWKDKLAAGFTNSSTLNGDKLHTLSSLSLFAAQHSMIWLPLGILPKYDEEGAQLEEPNGLASYLGLMTYSKNSKEYSEPEDLHTAEQFGHRIAELTTQLRFKNHFLNNYHYAHSGKKSN